LPTYEYRCISCEHQFERFQRMSDEPVKECELCGEPVKRLLFPVAIQFKGNGFYTTDYARRSTLGSAGGQNGDGGDSERSSEHAAASDSSGSPSGPAEAAKTAAPERSKPVAAATGTKSD
jgi:putative FmdB family regulatory protein